MPRKITQVKRNETCGGRAKEDVTVDVAAEEEGGSVGRQERE